MTKENLTFFVLGRWWIVGSAWSGHGPVQKENVTEANVDSSVQTVDASSKLLDIAKKQRMNTNLRKTIFCAMMTSEVCF